MRRARRDSTDFRFGGSVVAGIGVGVALSFGTMRSRVRRRSFTCGLDRLGSLNITWINERHEFTAERINHTVNVRCALHHPENPVWRSDVRAIQRGEKIVWSHGVAIVFENCMHSGARQRRVVSWLRLDGQCKRCGTHINGL